MVPFQLNAIWAMPKATVSHLAKRNRLLSLLIVRMSLTSTVALELSELDRVDIAAENNAPSTIPSTPIGILSTMNVAKTRSLLANDSTGGFWL